MDIYTELMEIAEKYDMPLTSMKECCEDIMKYQQVECPYGTCADGLRKWKKQSFTNNINVYVD